jgi:hypothetical protein
VRQDSPLDLDCCDGSFYQRRQSLIDQRLKEIAAARGEGLAQRVHASFTEYYGPMVRAERTPLCHQLHRHRDARSLLGSVPLRAAAGEA